MIKGSKIPIENIYYMLCYAWNILEQDDKIIVGSERFDNIYNLLARIYINGTSNIVKKGLNKYYIVESENSRTIKGKIDISESIKLQTFNNNRAICTFEEFSDNIVLNQIVKVTINILLKYPNLDKVYKDKLIILRRNFLHINDIQLSKNLFSQLKYNRNNLNYKMLMNISELIYNGLISNENGNDLIFADFLRDREMAKLFEKFVLNFYKLHLDKSSYKVYSPKISWNLDREIGIDEKNYYLI